MGLDSDSLGDAKHGYSARNIQWVLETALEVYFKTRISHWQSISRATVLTTVLEPSSSASVAKPSSQTVLLTIGYVLTTICRRPSSHVFFRVDPSLRSSTRRCSCIHMRSSASSSLPSLLAATMTVWRKWRAGVRRGRRDGAWDSVLRAEIWIVLRLKLEIELWEGS